jgi:hypothetical protein
MMNSDAPNPADELLKHPRGSKEWKRIASQLRTFDLIEEIMQLPEASRARIVLHALRDFPEIARSPRGLELIRVCKEALKDEPPYHGDFEKFIKRMDELEKEWLAVRRAMK